MANSSRKSLVADVVRKTRSRVSLLKYTLSDIHPEFRAVPFWEPGRANYILDADIIHTPEGIINRLLANAKHNVVTGCWEWHGGERPDRHEVLSVNGENIGVHRLMYAIAYMTDPKHFDVCHKCDNPCCLNPDHLFLGTRSDNIRDAVAKGRMPCNFGEASPNAKLTWAQVDEIRRRLENNETQESIASRFRITIGNVSAIKRGKSWAVRPISTIQN